MDEVTKGSGEDPISKFLSSPAPHYEEDAAAPVGRDDQVTVSHHTEGLKQRFVRFMFEKKPSEYSPLSPRSRDGTRSKIFFFNGNGRGR